MQRYSLEVKLFALEKRRDSSGWEGVRQAIKERFDIEPPTVRAMQRWEKQLATREDLSKALTEDAKKKAEVAKTHTLTQVAGGLLPTLWVAKDAGEDIESAGWKWFFSIVENVLGSEKFKRFLGAYLAEREGKPDLPAIPFTNA
jgi:hypothetical protein